jgi:tRNA pseudouridine38-40 synthase
MPTYRLLMAYDGTAYNGWQKQPRLPSIEGTLETIFRRTFKAELAILGASRTDAGVHALGQVVRIQTELVLEPDKLAFALNNSLPEDIMVRAAALVEDDYSPHVGVAQKTYYYHIFTKKPLPYAARYGWYYPRAIDEQLLRQALAEFVGTHDFRSFCCAEDTREDMVRTIESIELSYFKRFNAYRVTVRGEKFLRHMIRRIVGAAVTVATTDTRYTLADLKKVLHNKNPHHTLPNAPGKGLVLARIIYHGVHDVY